MYLSPDQRFLTSELMDTTIDPVQQARKDAEMAMAGLAQNHGSSKGSDHAPVTIVEFSDFECPYCRRFAGLLDEVLPQESDAVRVVFHHMPLSMHPWARTAAEGAACAQLQTNGAFWALHDQMFHHQAEITAVNVKDKLLEYARQVKGLDLMNFQDCLDNQLSLGLVLKDVNLASANNINSTPTLFVNGSRIPGVKDSADLRRIIEEAKKESARSPRSDSEDH
jgi:protein-disulfide isomerase